MKTINLNLINENDHYKKEVNDLKNMIENQDNKNNIITDRSLSNMQVFVDKK